MALTLEWAQRITTYLDHLSRLLTREIGTVELSGFTTLEQLHPSEAIKGPFRPMPEGSRWGRRWEYGWFKATVTVPQEAQGQWLVVRCTPGQEGYAMVNGQYRCSVSFKGAPGLSGERALIELTRRAKAGETFDLLVEACAGPGHSPNISSAMSDYGQAPWPEQQEPLITLPRTTLEIWNEELYQAYTDMRTLFDVRNNVPNESLRQATIDAALRQVTTTIDFNLPPAPFMQTVRAARRIMQPPLECRNGTVAPTYACVGHGHLDVAWLWLLPEGERKMVRTMSNTLSLAAEYPEYKFMQSQAYLFDVLKTKYPDLYAQIKERVRQGRIVADGGMWVEADTNITGGESLIRQFLHGKRFFKEEFGVESEILWLPDVFGYTAALPQIMRGCGVKYFTTQKIYWTYNGAETFPLAEFLWEGIDGSQVIAHLHRDYGSRTNPATLIQQWKPRAQPEAAPVRLQPFGWGDGGGGPDRDHLEFLRRCRDLQDVPRTYITSPVEFFADLEKRGVADARYVGELFYSCHLGVFTSQAKTKRGNRLGEFALREAEMWGAAAQALKGRAYPLRQMDLLWKRLLLHQFHDVLPGSSLHRVYEEAERAYEEILSAASAESAGAMAALAAEDADAMTFFNSLSWPRTVLAPLPKSFAQPQGVPVQEIEGVPHAEVRVPSCGWTTLRKGTPAAAQNALKAEAGLLENEHLRIELDGAGAITRIYDKDARRELAAGLCNEMAMFKDTPVFYNAWDLDHSYKCMPVELSRTAAIEVVARGPLAAVLRVRRTLNTSEMTQDILLRRGSRRVDFRTVIEWRETEKLLKARFAVNMHSDCALHEIQFGHVARPNHASRPFDADRYEVPQQKWTALVEAARGAAVLNDCKYGVNVERNSINLTLLRAPVAPDRTADRGRQVFTYAFYAWNGPMIESRLVHEAYDLNVPVRPAPGNGGETSLFSVDAPNVILETVKPAEDGSGDIVLRFYESMRTATRARVRLGLPERQAAETNMLEEGRIPVPVKDGQMELEFRPFEVKTVRLGTRAR